MGRSFARESNNGLIFYAGFYAGRLGHPPRHQTFSRDRVFTGGTRGWPQNKYINFTPRPAPVHPCAAHISASSPHTLAWCSFPVSSASRVYAHAHSAWAHAHRRAAGRATTSISRVHTHGQAHTCTCANARPPAYK